MTPPTALASRYLSNVHRDGIADPKIPRLVPSCDIKRLARHSDVRLTEDIYTDFELMAGPEREAAEMLVPERRRQRFVPGVR